jgi:hypothetical protein
MLGVEAKIRLLIIVLFSGLHSVYTNSKSTNPLISIDANKQGFEEFVLLSEKIHLQ